MNLTDELAYFGSSKKPSSTAEIQSIYHDDEIDALCISIQHTIKWVCEHMLPKFFSHLHYSEYWYAYPVSIDVMIYIFESDCR